MAETPNTTTESKVEEIRGQLRAAALEAFNASPSTGFQAGFDAAVDAVVPLLAAALSEEGQGEVGRDPRLGYGLASEALRDGRTVRVKLSLARGYVEGTVISVEETYCLLDVSSIGSGEPSRRVYWAEIDGFAILPPDPPDRETGHRLSREDGERLEKIAGLLLEVTEGPDPYVDDHVAFLRRLSQGILSEPPEKCPNCGATNPANNVRELRKGFYRCPNSFHDQPAPSQPVQDDVGRLREKLRADRRKAEEIPSDYKRVAFCRDVEAFLDAAQSDPKSSAPDVERLREKLLSAPAQEAGRFALMRGNADNATVAERIQTITLALLDAVLPAPDVERLGGEEGRLARVPRCACGHWSPAASCTECGASLVLDFRCEHSKGGLEDGAALIAAERVRQVEAEGWTPEHDDRHNQGELVSAAIVYARAPLGSGWDPKAPEGWPWEDDWFKPRDDVTNLVKAGALLAAEIDRIHRDPRSQPNQGSDQPKEGERGEGEPCPECGTTSGHHGGDCRLADTDDERDA